MALMIDGLLNANVSIAHAFSPAPAASSEDDHARPPFSRPVPGVTQEGMMKANGLSFSRLTPALCGLGLLGAPQIALAQAATYWGINGTTNPAPYVTPPYTCVTNYYVAPNGSDSNSGTSGAPWQTVSGAVAHLSTGASQPGVCVNVNPGTYTESVVLNNLNGGWDGATGYLVFRSTALREATLQEPYANIATDHGNVVIQKSRFVIFDGFTVTGYSNVPLAGAPGLAALSSHHIKFLNNTVHDVGGFGIGSIQSDYVYAQGNIVYNASCCTPASGIDYWEAVATDTNAGFHNVISSNIIYNNSEGADGKSAHTQGHGIMLDSFRLGPAGSYPAATLIENNLVYGNGGIGINIYFSNNVTIRNNTVFDNLRDPLLSYASGDIAAINSSYVTGTNNIAVTNITTNSKLLSIWDQTWDHTNIGNVWANNLTFNGNPGQPSVGTFYLYGLGAAVTAANGNILGSDPRFVNAPAEGFSLQNASPAIGHGTSAYGVPALDLAGNVRSPAAADIGAFAFNVVPPS
jgi:serralysin